MKRKILITGGCGKIGSYFAGLAASRYFIRIGDRIPWNIEKNGRLSGESFVVDLQDLAQCRELCEGMDAVIHLAADADPEADAFLDPDDFNQLLPSCLETPNIQFAIAHAISDNRFKRLDLTETIEMLAYAPKADAFEIFKLAPK